MDNNTSIGDSLLISNGINLSKVKSSLPKNTRFRWIEPPISSIGNIFPSEATYHPLLSNSKHEIASYLFNIEGSDLQEEQKDIYRQKVQDIVETGPFIQARAAFYGFLVITIIALIITINIQNPNYWIVTVLVVITILTGINAYGFSSVYGKSKWMDFENDLQSQINAGVLPNKILENYRQEEQNQKMVDAISRQRANNRPVGFNMYPYQ